MGSLREALRELEGAKEAMPPSDYDGLKQELFQKYLGVRCRRAPTTELGDVEYLREHNIVSEVDVALKGLLKEKPAEPIAFLGRHFTARAEGGQRGSSLYERLGGSDAVEAAVDKFYKLVLADPRVSRFFASTDMARQRRMQKEFLSYAFGGPKRYNGRDLRDAHKHLVHDQGLGEEHFTAIVELLARTLREMGVKETDIAEVAKIAKSTREDVLDLPKDLFTRLGGEPALDAAVNNFYDKVLADPRVSFLFNGIDTKRLRRMQREFLTYAFGGPQKYTGRDLKEAHLSLVEEKGLCDEHFDAILNLLHDTLSEMGVAPSLVSEAIAIANSVRGSVLNKKASLYDRLGGATAVESAVEIFYRKVLEDSNVKHFFAGVDMNRQRRMQRDFLSFAFGGPVKYTGRDLREAHHMLGPDDDVPYDTILRLLRETLEELGAAPEDVDEAVHIADSVRSDVLGKARTKTLLDRVGEAGLSRAVDIFYAKVMGDSRVSTFFTGINISRQKKVMREYLTYAFGGHKKYTGKALNEAHRRLVLEKGLNDSHFFVFIDILMDTLGELGVESSDAKEAKTIIRATRDDVLGGEDLDSTLTLYERMGAEMIEKVVDKWYDKVIMDDRIAHFFDNVDMAKQLAAQKSFISCAFGGPAKYHGRQLKHAHRRLVKEKGLNGEHFDVFLGLLEESMNDLKLPSSDIDEAMSVISSTRKQVLGEE